MAAFLNRYGPTTVLTSTAGSTAANGSWYAWPGDAKSLSFQAVLQASSVGATAGTTVHIEVCNSTGYGAVATKWATFALTCTTDLVTDGGCCTGSSMAGPWSYVRAKLTSLTTSTAGSAGSPSVTVIAHAA